MTENMRPKLEVSGPTGETPTLPVCTVNFWESAQACAGGTWRANFCSLRCKGIIDKRALRTEPGQPLLRSSRPEIHCSLLGPVIDVLVYLCECERGISNNIKTEKGQKSPSQSHQSALKSKGLANQ